MIMTKAHAFGRSETHVSGNGSSDTFTDFLLQRTGTDIDEALSALQPWKDNIWVIQQLVQNDISSTKVRLFLRRDMSIRYLVPEPVVQYIEEHGLFDEDGAASTTSGDGDAKGKARTPVGGKVGESKGVAAVDGVDGPSRSGG